ncbi:MAG: RHS repeat-associated core domain-containing protein [Anaerolineae bacterium]
MPATNYLFAGQQYDAATGLYSMRARYYDPTTGRFLSRDTWPIDYANPAELNRYVYAAGNPVRWSDPSGRSTFFEYTLKTAQSIAADITNESIAGFFGQ